MMRISPLLRPRVKRDRLEGQAEPEVGATGPGGLGQLAAKRSGACPGRRGFLVSDGSSQDTTLNNDHSKTAPGPGDANDSKTALPPESLLKPDPKILGENCVREGLAKPHLLATDRQGSTLSVPPCCGSQDRSSLFLKLHLPAKRLVRFLWSSTLGVC
ncbi:hypothetical protein VTI74DRAFT_10492 [Chaetomium olivicolor]